MKDKKIQEKKKLKEKGITLIALVVTIIILLILAGVTLNMAMSGDGLFSRAKNATDSYKKAQDDEEKLIENLTEEIDKLSPKNAGTSVEVPKGEKWEEDKVTPVADGKGSAIPIPNGFYYVGGNIDTGIVISDEENDDLNNSKKGNQFVWIPCTTEEYEKAVDDTMEKKWSTNNQYKDNGDNSGKEVSKGTGNGLGWHDDYSEDDNEKIKETHIAMDTDSWENKQTEVAKASLEIYKGFYVARFEAGIPEEATIFYTNTVGAYNGIPKGDNKLAGLNEVGRGNANETSDIQNYKPLSKKGVQAWNFITQPNAKMVSENMYKDEVKGVKSYLIDNTAWNVICNKFNNVLGTNIEGKTITNSTKIGNCLNNRTTKYTDLDVLWALHKMINGNWNYATEYQKGNILESDLPNVVGENRIELATGSSDDFKVYNIYDMAGNMWEWTTGHNIKSEKMYVVPRGGSFHYTGDSNPVVQACGGDECINYHGSVGFRTILYIK